MKIIKKKWFYQKLFIVNKNIISINFGMNHHEYSFYSWNNKNKMTSNIYPSHVNFLLISTFYLLRWLLQTRLNIPPAIHFIPTQITLFYWIKFINISFIHCLLETIKKLEKQDIDHNNVSNTSIFMKTTQTTVVIMFNIHIDIGFVIFIYWR